ncbi:PAAR domain-containing protein [Burkholderia guangdongensis]|uniref:PAAR domain-containing protein n=1 Tax=Burkholderia guangdongensis TaxID=1792500 RepID=UPI0015C763F7|nr:PAAR domain-containing protein [Burkholderia guangdongensis]
MRRYNLRENDNSTSGGVVIEGIPDDTLDGVPLTFLGAKVVCPVCKQTGVIVGQGPRYPDTSMGKQPALDDDICVCGCEPSPRMIASQNKMFEDHLESNIAKPGFASKSPSQLAAAAGTIAMAVAYDERFTLRSVDGRALAYAAYALRRETGTFEYGEADGNGHTHLLSAVDATEDIHVFLAG